MTTITVQTVTDSRVETLVIKTHEIVYEESQVYAKERGDLSPPPEPPFTIKGVRIGELQITREVK